MILSTLRFLAVPAVVLSAVATAPAQHHGGGGHAGGHPGAGVSHGGGAYHGGAVYHGGSGYHPGGYSNNVYRGPYYSGYRPAYYGTGLYLGIGLGGYGYGSGYGYPYSREYGYGGGYYGSAYGGGTTYQSTSGYYSTGTVVVNNGTSATPAIPTETIPPPGLGGETGLRLVDLFDGPAKKAGLRKGDIILKVDGRRTMTFDQLRAVLMTAGETVVVEYLDAATGTVERANVGVDAAKIGASVIEVPVPPVRQS